MTKKTINFKNHPLHSFLETLLEANQLLLIIDDLEENEVEDFEKKEQAIYKNLIINLSACFEVSLNTILDDAVAHLIDKLKSSDKLSNNVKIRISTNLIKSKDEREIWKISGDGWKDEVVKNFETLSKKFNSPRPDNIDDLFYKTIGLKKITDSFHWDNNTKEESIKMLNDFLDLRGKITHHYRIKKSISYEDIQKYVNYLYCIGICASNKVKEHLFKLTNSEPWYTKKVELIVK